MTTEIDQMIQVSEIMFTSFVVIYKCLEPEVEFLEDCTCEDYWNHDRSEILACKRFFNNNTTTWEVRQRLLPVQPSENFESKPSPFDGRGFWGNYKDNSVGRAINHIHHICTLRHAEDCVFHGNGLITQGQTTPFAFVDWSRGWPYFTFVSDTFNSAQKQILEKEGFTI